MLEFDGYAASAAAERDSDDDDYGLATSKDASPTAAPPPPPPRLSPEALKELSERESEYWGETVSTPRNMRREGEYLGEVTGTGTATAVGGGGSDGMQRGVFAATGDYWRDVAGFSNGARIGVLDAGAKDRGGVSDIIGVGRSNERWGMMLGRETLDSDISEIVSHGVVPEQRHHTPKRGGDERAIC